MKFFFPVPPDPSTHIQKHSPYPYYLADLAKKLQKNHSNTLKMDPQKAHLSVLTQNSVTKNPSPFLQKGKMGTTQIPSTRSKPKKKHPFSNNLKNSKNFKKPQFTYENFFDLAPIPVMPCVKMIPIPTLHSTTVKENTNIDHPDLENGPYPEAFPIYSGRLDPIGKGRKGVHQATIKIKIKIPKRLPPEGASGRMLDRNLKFSCFS